MWHLLLSPPFFLLLLLFLSLSFSVLCVCVSTIGYLDLRASRAERDQEKLGKRDLKKRENGIWAMLQGFLGLRWGSTVLA